jgi:hypothetical protein
LEHEPPPRNVNMGSSAYLQCFFMSLVDKTHWLPAMKSGREPGAGTRRGVVLRAGARVHKGAGDPSTPVIQVVFCSVHTPLQSSDAHEMIPKQLHVDA